MRWILILLASFAFSGALFAEDEISITGQDVKFISGTQGSDSRVELTSDTASLKHGDSRTVVVDSDKVDVNGGALEVT